MDEHSATLPPYPFTTSSIPNALYFSPRLPATGLPCRLDVHPTQLSIRFSEHPDETVPWNHLTVKSGGFEHNQLIVSWMAEGEERRVYVKDSAAIAALTTSAPVEVSRRIRESVHDMGKARRVTRVWIWSTAVSIVAMFAGLWLASDVLVQMTVKRIPLEWERSLGESARQQLLLGQRVMSAGSAVKAVEDMTRRLADQVPDSPYRFEVTVVRNDAVNAMALPGGSVIVYTGLLKQAESPEEVAGVLAHELNHVLLRHGLENMVQSVGMAAIVMAVLGNQQGLVGALERLGIQLTTLKFSREKETEADLDGLRLLHRAQISPAGMIQFFERLAKTEGTPVALLSTHPMSAERAARLKTELQSLPTQPTAVLTAKWQEIKNSL